MRSLLIALALATPPLTPAIAGPTGGAVLTPLGPVTSCSAADLCNSLAAHAALMRREAEIVALTADWTTSQRESLAALRTAQRRFAGALARHEVDRTGGEADARTAARDQTDAFFSLLRRVASRTGRSLAGPDPRRADETLNETYAMVMAEPVAWGTVDRAGIRTTERAWLAYRDAFLALAATLDAPTAPIATELAVRRTNDLEGLLAD